VFNSDFNGFSFAEQALSIGLPLRDGAMAANARRLLQLETLPDTTARISDHVRHSIALALPVGRAALSDVAKRLSTTERGLQRKLSSEGETFVGLLNEVRRDLAQRQLGDSSRSLTVIAQSIGYADLSSFTRWFEREFETPPSRWRKDLHFWRSGAS
jgi:AraC-like DNA-binding protein